MTRTLQIVNWRAFGDTESYVRVAVIEVAENSDDLTKILKAEHALEKGVPVEHLDEDHPAFKEENAVYFNDDISIADGEIIEPNPGRVTSGGKRYRIRIEEVE